MWFQIKAYIHFIFHSKNQHGIHSPFVYQLITQCLYDRKSYPAYKVLKKFRRELSLNNQAIHLSQKKTRLLYRIAHYFKASIALETSASKGLASAALSFECAEEVFSITPLLPNQNIKQILKPFKIISSIPQSSWESALDSSSVKKLGLVYVEKEGIFPSLLEGFQKLFPFQSDKSVYIFEGIHQSPENEEDWKQIKAHAHVQVTIDIFFWGLVFFKTDQAKQHFKIRV